MTTKGKEEARKSSICSGSDSREGMARQMNDVVAAERASRLTEYTPWLQVPRALISCNRTAACGLTSGKATSLSTTLAILQEIVLITRLVSVSKGYLCVK